MELREIQEDIRTLEGYWSPRMAKFKEWMNMLKLEDILKTATLESAVTNSPRTDYGLAHYLLTAGKMKHSIPVTSDSPLELDKQARCERGCSYMWEKINEKRMLGGKPVLLSELNYHLLTLGWYAVLATIDEATSELLVIPWHPAQVFPRYEDGLMTTCLHKYSATARSLVRKAKLNNWSYTPPRNLNQNVVLDDYYFLDENNSLFEMVLVDNKPVTGEELRDNILLLTAPVGGFPDDGIIQTGEEWKGLVGQSIMEVNNQTIKTYNRWLTFLMQILRDTAQPKWQEHSTGEPKIDPEKLNDRGFVAHFEPGEGLETIPMNPIPMELQSLLISFQRDLQKGGFPDTLHGLLEGRTSGYAFSGVADMANQLLLPYRTGKDFVVSQCDRFWLRYLKEHNKTFQIKGQLLEELKPEDIPEDVVVNVFSELATPKDWLEKSTTANYLKDSLDETTILEDILKVADTQMVKRRKQQDLVMKHPMTINIELISSFKAHAEYLEQSGDAEQAQLFRKAAAGLEAQFGAPAPGQGLPVEASRIQDAVEAGASPRRPRVSPQVVPPTELRR